MVPSQAEAPLPELSLASSAAFLSSPRADAFGFSGLEAGFWTFFVGVLAGLSGLGLLNSGIEEDGFEAIPERRLAGRGLCAPLDAAPGVLSEVP